MDRCFMRHGVGNWVAAAVLACSCLLNAGQAAEADVPSDALAVHVEMKLPGTPSIAADIVVLPGQPADMVYPGPDGRTFRVNVESHVAVAPSGAAAAQLKATLFERVGEGWRELAAPEMVAPLEEPASFRAQYPPGHQSGLEVLQVDARRVFEVARKEKLVEAACPGL